MASNGCSARCTVPFKLVNVGRNSRWPICCSSLPHCRWEASTLSCTLSLRIESRCLTYWFTSWTASRLWLPGWRGGTPYELCRAPSFTGRGRDFSCLAWLFRLPTSAQLQQSSFSLPPPSLQSNPLVASLALFGEVAIISAIFASGEFTRWCVTSALRDEHNRETTSDQQSQDLR